MKIIKTIYNIFLGLLAAVAILLIISVFPITGNYRVLVVKSGSMEPIIKTGSIVIVKPAKEYRVGDIITFGQVSKTKAPTTHRIFETKTDETGNKIYITKGDANNAPDQQGVSQREVIGKVLSSVPYIGYAVDFAKQPTGFVLVIVIPAVVIVNDEVRNIWQEIRKMRKQKTENKEQKTTVQTNSQE